MESKCLWICGERRYLHLGRFVSETSALTICYRTEDVNDDVKIQSDESLDESAIGIEDGRAHWWKGGDGLQSNRNCWQGR